MTKDKVKYFQFEINCLEAFVHIIESAHKHKGCRLTKEQCSSLSLSDIAETAAAYEIQKKAGKIEVIK